MSSLYAQMTPLKSLPLAFRTVIVTFHPPFYLVKKGLQGRKNVIRRQGCGFLFGNDIDIVIAVKLAPPASKKFTDKPFDPVALDSPADSAGYRNAQPRTVGLSRKYQRDENVILKSATMPGERDKIGALQNSVGLFESSPR